MGVCFLLLSKDLTEEGGLEGGLLACGTAGSWQQTQWWEGSLLKAPLVEAAWGMGQSINVGVVELAGPEQWEGTLQQEDSPPVSEKNSLLLLLHSFQILGKNLPSLLCLGFLPQLLNSQRD